jgi:FtsP/CotA-like multicopper oxidase with cupredoxin domain
MKTDHDRTIGRRAFLVSAAALGAGVSTARAQHPSHHLPASETSNVRSSEGPREGDPPIDRRPALPLGEAGKDYTPVVTPNNVSLAWKAVDGVKVYHLIAEEVEHEFAPGLKAHCWGFNGRIHGPTIEAVEGDRVRIYVTNRLPSGTSVHWHGLLVPNGMDGVAGLTQKVIRPGETFRYEFTLRQHGTHMYHSHHDEMTQMALGTMGLFVIHPRAPRERPDRDFAYMLAEWRIDVGTARPNPNEMLGFNLFTLNGKAFPATAPMLARLGDRVRIRVANVAAMNHHPIHLHGYQFRVTETDGGQIPASAQQLETSVLVAIGQSRTFEFVADAPGDWAMHCHMTHHVMNQMGDKFPNMIGVEAGDVDARVRQLLPGYMTMGTDGMAEHGMHVESGHVPVPENSIPMRGGAGPFDYITMGGLFTLLKVREKLDSDDRDPGWYRHPRSTVASRATADELRRDGIDV